MAFVLSFVTSDYDQGKSILIQDASTDWANVPAGVVSATFTITSLYSGTVLSPATATKTIVVGVVPFTAGFQYEIKNTDLAFSVADTIKDSVYRIKMEISDVGGVIAGAGNTYTSDEVVYYNAIMTRDVFIATKAAYIDDVYNKDMDYANWLDFLVTSIEANSISGNSSAVYYNFDIFDRLMN